MCKNYVWKTWHRRCFYFEREIVAKYALKKENKKHTTHSTTQCTNWISNGRENTRCVYYCVCLRRWCYFCWVLLFALIVLFVVAIIKWNIYCITCQAILSRFFFSFTIFLFGFISSRFFVFILICCKYATVTTWFSDDIMRINSESWDFVLIFESKFNDIWRCFRANDQFIGSSVYEVVVKLGATAKKIVYRN